MNIKIPLKSMILMIFLYDQLLAADGHVVRPWVVATLPMQGEVKQLKVSKDKKTLFAIIAGGQKDKEGLYLFDIEQANKLRLTGFLALPNPKGFLVNTENTRLYLYNHVSKDKHSGIRIVDITYVNQPKILAKKTEVDIIADISPDGRHILMTEKGSAFFSIYNVERDKFESRGSSGEEGSKIVRLDFLRNKQIVVQFSDQLNSNPMLVVYDFEPHDKTVNQRYRHRQDLGKFMATDRSTFIFSKWNKSSLFALHPKPKVLETLPVRLSYKTVFANYHGEILLSRYKQLYFLGRVKQGSLVVKRKFDLHDYVKSAAIGENKLIYLGLGRQILVMDPEQRAIDKKVLIAAHKKALNAYRQKRQESKYSASVAALKAFENSRIQEYLWRPHSFKPNKLAEILNDYAFFLQNKERQQAISLYQQVIKIDPNRAVAYLNLGDLWRTELQGLSLKEKKKHSKKIKWVYLQYKKLKGRTNRGVKDFLSLNLLDTPIDVDCDYIARYYNQGRFSEILGPPAIITYGGRKLRISVQYSGTARMPWVRVFDLESNEQINEEFDFVMDDDDSRWIENISFVPVEDDTHLIYYNDGDDLKFSRSVAGSACSFFMSVKKSFTKKNVDKVLCKKVAAGNITYIGEPLEHGLGDSNLTWHVHKEGYQVDVNNDGQEDNIVKIQYASSQGRGCVYDYFAVMNKAKTKLQQDSLQELIKKLPGSRNHCSGNQIAWFHYKGINYFESKYKGNKVPTRGDRQFHTVSYIKDNRINTVCDANFDMKVYSQ